MGGRDAAIKRYLLKNIAMVEKIQEAGWVAIRKDKSDRAAQLTVARCCEKIERLHKALRILQFGKDLV